MNALTDLCLSFDALQLEKSFDTLPLVQTLLDCFFVLQNHTFRQYFLPMCLLVVAVSLGIKTRLKQCHLVVLMNTMGTVHSILCISIVIWASEHFGISCFCFLRLCVIETSPCCIRKAPVCVSLEFRVDSSLCFIRKAPMCVSLAFRVDSGGSFLSIHHGPMVTYECCHESKQ